MDSPDTHLTRRGLLATGAGAAAGLAATGGAVAQTDAYDGYIQETDWDGQTLDARGVETVTVDVGAGDGFAFDPVAILVEPGQTVSWQWTGEGGGHNVVHDVDDPIFDSREDHDGDTSSEAGFTYEHTFEEMEDGAHPYVCTPHRGVEMKGVVVVGEEHVETDLAAMGDGAEPEYDDWFDNVPNFERTVDERGQDQVEVAVGTGDDGFQFSPPAVHVDAGTTVIWEWTGEGGNHDVVHTDGAFESELTADEGHTFEHTFDEDGIYRYYCTPHQELGMKGAIAVGDDIPMAEATVAPLELDSVWGGAAAVGVVALLGVAAYNELFGDHAHDVEDADSDTVETARELDTEADDAADSDES